MLTSFYSGLTGLSAYASALNIVGNNLANINTVGFKGSTISFGDLVTSTFGGISASAAGNPMQIGLGVLPNSVNGLFSQGSLQSTTEATNVAIEGNGFFLVGDTATSPMYTRAGNFSFNKDGYLITPSGKFVLGYVNDPVTNTINPSGPVQRISLTGNALSAPEPTLNFQAVVNLNVDNPRNPGAVAAPGTTSPPAVLPQPVANSTYTSSLTIYDSKGTPHTLSIRYAHLPLAGGNDVWQYDVTMPATDFNAALPPTTPPVVIATGNINFLPDGSLNPAIVSPVVLNIPVYANGASAQVINWNLRDTTTLASLLTGYPITSATSSTNADGYAPGTLSSILVSKDGEIQGIYSNGRVQEIAILSTATFNNNNGLIRMGNNLFAQTSASGIPSVGAPGSGGRGTITGSALESSNVDIASEFTNMMVFERGYQANSRIITTSDEVIQEALNIKR